MFDLIRSIRRRDPAEPTFFEVLLAYPGVHAVGLHRLSSLLWRMKLRAVARLSAHFSRLVTGIEIHPAATIGKRLFIDHGMGVVIGATAQIGNDVTIYHGVTLGGRGNEGPGKRHPTLKDKVMVGSGAQVLGAITLGEKCCIGANAVVTRDVPEFCTAVGNPGKIVKGMDKSPIYGLPYSANPDPIGEAINALQNEINELKRKMEMSSVNDNSLTKEKRSQIGIWMGDSI